MSKQKCCTFIFKTLTNSKWEIQHFLVIFQKAKHNKLPKYLFFQKDRWQEWKLQLSHYSVSVLSCCMTRQEFVQSAQDSTKGWIQSRAPRGQAGGQPSLGGTSQSPPAYCRSPILFLLPQATHHFPQLWQTSSASQPYPTPTPNICPVHLICLSQQLNFMQAREALWPQLCFHFVAALLSSWL